MPMDNSGTRPLQVPGFGELPIYHELPSEHRFVNGLDRWHQTPGATIRELAMVAAMNAITEKPNWNIDIFNKEVPQSWRADAENACPKFIGEWWPPEIHSRKLLSDKAWSWCMMELRDKAKDLEGKQFVRILDTGSSAYKSDTLVPISCAQNLKTELASFYRYRSLERIEPDKNGMLDVVDPDLFPLIYGKTKVLQHGGVVDPDHLFRGYDRARCAPKLEPSDAKRVYAWSGGVQWLPCQVDFVGEKGNDVRISSYVNNIHPKHRSLYALLESLISHSLPLWDECLIKGLSNIDVNVFAREDEERPGRGFPGRAFSLTHHYTYINDQRQRGRVPLRMVSYGIPLQVRMPEWAIHFDGNPYKKAVEEFFRARAAAKAALREHPERSQAAVQGLERVWDRWRFQSGKKPYPDGQRIPDPTPEQWEMAEQFLTSPHFSDRTLPENWRSEAYKLMETRVRRAQESWDYPEPGDAVSYEDWRAGTDVHRPVVPRAERAYKYDGQVDDRYAPTDALHERYTVQLSEQFRQRGLQVVVRIGGIEIDPDLPIRAAEEMWSSEWQVAGRCYEHIVATAIYVYDTSNVEECRVNLRQAVSRSDACYQTLHNYVRDNSPQAFRQWATPVTEREDLVRSMRGFTHADTCFECGMGQRPPVCSSVGEINMPLGRLITFPNVMEYRIMPSKLIDETISGHCRFVTLHLVDPHYRICSTRNVPPQQHEWWKEEVGAILSEILPREMAEQICQESESDLMSNGEAISLRRQQRSTERQFRNVSGVYR